MDDSDDESAERDAFLEWKEERRRKRYKEASNEDIADHIKWKVNFDSMADQKLVNTKQRMKSAVWGISQEAMERCQLRLEARNKLRALIKDKEFYKKGFETWMLGSAEGASIIEHCVGMSQEAFVRGGVTLEELQEEVDKLIEEVREKVNYELPDVLKSLPAPEDLKHKTQPE